MSRRRPNFIGNIAAIAWLGFVVVPIVSIFITALSKEFRTGGLSSLASGVTLEHFTQVLGDGFLVFVFNTLVVTIGVVGLTLLVGVPLGFYIVRSQTPLSLSIFRLFLFGLAVPAQVVIIPLYAVISKLGLYDTLPAVILPTAAFALPVGVLVLSAGMREIPRELYEAMEIDGADSIRIFLRLVLPLSRTGVATVAIFTALQAWNGFLFPLILTQSQSTSVVSLGLYTYIGRYYADIPALFSAVLLSALPVFVLYLFARQSLVRGLTGLGK